MKYLMIILTLFITSCSSYYLELKNGEIVRPKCDPIIDQNCWCIEKRAVNCISGTVAYSDDWKCVYRVNHFGIKYFYPICHNNILKDCLNKVK